MIRQPISNAIIERSEEAIRSRPSREAMLERQREGIAKAKRDGRYKGRVPTARRQTAEVVRLKAEGVRPSEIASRLGIGRASVYRVLGEQNAGERQEAA